MNKNKNLILQKFRENDADETGVFCDSDMPEYLPTIGLDYHGTVYYKIVEEFKELGIVEQKGGGLVLKAFGRMHTGFEEVKQPDQRKGINNFTVELKDQILTILCEEIPAEGGLFSLEAKALVSRVNSDMQTVLTILKQFERNGLISELNAHPMALRLILMIEAVEFRNRGGFKMYEEIFQMTVEKLILEIQTLQKSSPEVAERMTSLLANLTTISTFVFPQLGS